MPGGPFETLDEVKADLAQSRPASLNPLYAACQQAGIALGRFDKRVIDELAQLEREHIWVLASIIRRAGDSSREE